VSSTPDQIISQFIIDHGRMVDENFPATALTQTDAISFIELLARFGRCPIGIELWRRIPTGYDVDGLADWHSSDQDDQSKREEARHYLSNGKFGDSDLFVVQYT